MTTSLIGQYDDWTFVRILPENEIDAFEPMSEKEILALSNGIIYYRYDLGSTWSVYLETKDDPINSLTSDKDGNYYYKNTSGLSKGRIGQEENKLTESLDSFKIRAVKGSSSCLTQNPSSLTLHLPKK